MGLAVRELELVLIARDQASSTIARVGGAFAILGAAITMAGIKSVKELGEMTNEAMQFQRQAALAVTQADNLGATVENVSEIINRVGANMAVPFEELQGSLFDIFSTFTEDQLSSLGQAEEILNAIAKSAVAGQAPTEDIGRAVIAWINALDQPATLENVNRILDIQFEMIRKGAGTYTEFAGEVGKSIPAFSAASQEVETFGGIMAFLTKNGLDAAMASTSAARAVELMFAPKAIKGLKSIGVAIEDGNGQFRQMHDIIRDMLPTFEGLSDAEQKIKFKEIFGTGRIQARRFFDLAIPNFEELNFLIETMEDSGGEVAKAFELLSSQAATKVDLMKNRWEIFRREMGERFLETLESRVFPALEKLWNWWDKLDPKMKDNIARWMALGSAILIAAGALMVFIGVGLLFTALLKAFGSGSAIAGLGKLLISLGWIGLAIAIIVGLVVLLWKNWKRIGPLLARVWEDVLTAVQRFFDDNAKFIEEYKNKALEAWEAIQRLGTAIWERMQTVWEGIWGGMLAFWDTWGADIKGTWDKIWTEIKDIFLDIWDVIIGILDFFTALFEGDWETVWETVKDIFKAAWEIIKSLAKIAWEGLKLLWKLLWAGIIWVAKWAWEQIQKFLSWSWGEIKKLAKKIWDPIAEFFRGIWDKIWDFFTTTDWLTFFQELPGKIVDALFSLGGLLLEWAGTALGWIATGFWWAWNNYILPFLIRLPAMIITAIGFVLGLLYQVGKWILEGMWIGMKWIWDNSIGAWLDGRKGGILEFFEGAIEWLLGVGKAILTGLYDGILWVWDNLLYVWLTDVGASIVEGIGDLGSILGDIGVDLWEGMVEGLKDSWHIVEDYFGGLKDDLLKLLSNAWESITDALTYENIQGEAKKAWDKIFKVITDWWEKDTLPFLKGLPGKVKDEAVKIWNKFKDGMQEAWDNTIYPWLQDLPANMASGLTEGGPILFQAGKALVSDLIEGMREAWKGFKSLFTGEEGGFQIDVADIFGDLGDISAGIHEWMWSVVRSLQNASWEVLWPWIQSLPGWFADRMMDVWGGSFAVIGWTWNLVTGWVEGLADAWQSLIGGWISNRKGDMTSRFSGAGGWLVDVGAQIISGLWQGMTNVWNAGFGFFTAIPGKILSFFTGSPTWLTASGRSIISGLWTGLKAIWNNPVSSWFRSLYGKILGFFTSPITLLYGKGSDIIRGLWNGAQAVWLGTLWGWFISLKNKIPNSLSSPGTWLLTKGRLILTGLLNGITRKWYGAVYGWLRSLGTKAKAAVGDLGRKLWNAGRQLIGGLWGGMKSKIGGMLSWLRRKLGEAVSVARSILRLGSPSKVFFDIGSDIVEGLHQGLKSRWGDVEATLRVQSENVAGSYAAALSPDTPAPVTNDYGQTFNFGDIVTEGPNLQEIMEQIAWEIRLV